MSEYGDYVSLHDVALNLPKEFTSPGYGRTLCGNVDPWCPPYLPVLVSSGF